MHTDAEVFLATACDCRLMNAQNKFFCFPENLMMDFLPGFFKMMVRKLLDFKLPGLLHIGKRVAAYKIA